MKKSIIKFAALGLAGIGAVIYGLYKHDEKEMMNNPVKVVKEWADEKVRSERDEQTSKLYSEHSRKKARLEKLIGDENDEIRKRTKECIEMKGINAKENDLKAAYDAELSAYKNQIDYDEQISRAKANWDNSLLKWKEENEYEAKKDKYKNSLKESERTYERAKSALNLIDNDDIKRKTKELLKEEHERSYDDIRKSEKELDKQFNEARDAFNKEYKKTVNNLEKDLEQKKITLDDKYSDKFLDIEVAKEQCKDEIIDSVHEARDANALMIIDEYEASRKAVDEAKEIENSIADTYAKDYEKHAGDIYVNFMQKKGWGKTSQIIMVGVLPITVGGALILFGGLVVTVGIRNITMIMGVK